MPEIKESFSYTYADKFEIDDYENRHLFLNDIVDENVFNSLEYTKSTTVGAESKKEQRNKQKLENSIKESVELENEKVDKCPEYIHINTWFSAKIPRIRNLPVRFTCGQVRFTA